VNAYSPEKITAARIDAAKPGSFEHLALSILAGERPEYQRLPATDEEWADAAARYLEERDAEVLMALHRRADRLVRPTFAIRAMTSSLGSIRSDPDAAYDQAREECGVVA